ncbi:hypothetical protein Btru_043280 [Bulinus truncatus]|nr:hypothetical protein Btru_043280 [Bulinus truncatus]
MNISLCQDKICESDKMTHEMSAFLVVVASALHVQTTKGEEPTVKLYSLKLEEGLHFEGCEPQTSDIDSKTECARSCMWAGSNCALFSFRKSSCDSCASCFICRSGDVVKNLTFSSVSLTRPHQIDFSAIVSPAVWQSAVSTIATGSVFYLRGVMLDNNGLILAFYKSGNIINFYFRARNDNWYGGNCILLNEMWYGSWGADIVYYTKNFEFIKTVEIHVLFQTAGAVFYVNRKYLATYPNSKLPPSIIRNIILLGNIYIERMYI